MISLLRKQFNQAFTASSYDQYLATINANFPNTIEFRIAETPVFIPKDFTTQLLAAGDYIAEFILQDGFQEITKGALNHQIVVPNETAFPECLVIDFAIAANENGFLSPQLIELQGFPSLFAFEVLQNHALRNSFNIPIGFTNYLNGYTESKYTNHLQKMIQGDQNKHTVLLEIKPHQQKTRIDFYLTQQITGIPIICVSELFVVGNELFYQANGKPKKIERIYNRIVWDELKTQTTDIQEKAALLQLPIDIEWVTHPNHFYRISKYLIPFLQHSAVPFTSLVSNLASLPKDLENYVLKPLYSFAGQGVVIDVTEDAITTLKKPSDWILQRKVHYAPVIETPTGPAKAEIRLFYFYDHALHKYIATNNLTRLSKGKMIGVDYNKEATWVGGTLSYFEN
jgi:hypothetical protein